MSDDTRLRRRRKKAQGVELAQAVQVVELTPVVQETVVELTPAVQETVVELTPVVRETVAELTPAVHNVPAETTVVKTAKPTEPTVEPVQAEIQGTVQAELVFQESAILMPVNANTVDTGNPERFANVMHTCIRSGDAGASLLLCHDTLRDVTPADVGAYARAQPAAHRRLGTSMADVMTRLHANHDYRSVGLYVALLMQGIDLTDTSDVLAQGASGEACQRLAAMVRQSLAARESRARSVPTWTIVTMSVLGGLLAVCVLFILTVTGMLIL